MISLHANFLSLLERGETREKVGPESYDEILRARADEKEVLEAVHIACTVAKKVAISLQKGKLTELDPIVGENTCQVRGHHAIISYMNIDLQQEAQKVAESAKEILQKVNLLRGKNHQLDLKISQLDLLKKLGLDLEVSVTFEFCCLSYLLTCGKYFQMRPDGHETSGIAPSNIKNAVATKTCPINLIERLVSVARQRIATATIGYLQEIAKPLGEAVSAPLSDRCIRRVEGRTVRYDTSPALCNFKAVLLSLQEHKIPLVVIDHKSSKPLIPLDQAIKPKDPIFVLEVFPGERLEEGVKEHGLLDLALANIAVLPQYSDHDDISELPEDTKEEIRHYRELGNRLKCLTNKPEIFRIAHTHAATRGELKL